jgi:hypothetical protein
MTLPYVPASSHQQQHPATITAHAPPPCRRASLRDHGGRHHTAGERLAACTVTPCPRCCLASSYVPYVLPFSFRSSGPSLAHIFVRQPGCQNHRCIPASVRTPAGSSKMHGMHTGSCLPATGRSRSSPPCAVVPTTSSNLFYSLSGAGGGKALLSFGAAQTDAWAPTHTGHACTRLVQHTGPPLR